MFLKVGLGIMWKKGGYILCLSLCFGGCRPQSDKNTAQGTVLAQAGNHYLYAHDVHNLPLQGVDSLSYLQEYVESWVLSELMLAYAAQQARLNMSELEEKIRAYRKALVQYVLEKQYLVTKLNTEVSQQEITAHYEEKAAHFVLSEDILQLLCVKVPRRAKEISRFRRRLKRYPLGSISKIQAYCAEHPMLCMLSDTTWVPLQKVLGSFPETMRVRAEQQLKKQSYFELRDSDYVYLIRVLAHQPRGTTPPVPYIRQEIIQNILSKRKKDLIKVFRENIWQKAKRDHAFQIHL